MTEERAPRPLTERDLELIHGLQIAPRISWADAARILGTTPASVAGRWRRLRQDGTAWITAHPGGGTPQAMIAFVEVDCVPGGKDEVKNALCLDPRVVSIEERARSGDFLLTVMTHDMADFSRYTLDELKLIPGVQGHRTHIVKKLHYEANAWRLDALDSGRRQQFRASARPDKGLSTPPAEPWPLIKVLSEDGRAGAADIARATGRNPATVRRQLARLLGSGMLTFRCELAQEYSRWPINGSYFARVPPGQLRPTVRALATVPELRLCASTTGESNLLFTVWAGSMAGLLDLEQRIGEHLPWLEIKDSSITLRTIKRMGWLLDGHGGATGDVVVPTALRPRREDHP